MVGAEVTPSLVVLEPGAMRGQTFALGKDYLTVGRSDDSDVRIDDPYVSRRHAVIRRANGGVVIEDAHSSAGVLVNSTPLVEPRLLRSGDRIRLGPVELEVEGASVGSAETRAFSPPPPPFVPPERCFDVHSQYGGSINNVAGNQYNEHALRIEPMRRRARKVMRAGSALLIAGFVVFVVGGANFATPILHCLGNPQQANACGSVDTTGWATAAVGSLIMTVGLVTIIASLFMKRGVRREEQRL